MKSISIVFTALTLFCLVLSANAAGPIECINRQVRVIIESPNPSKFRVHSCTVTLVSYTSKNTTRTVNIKKTGDTFVDFVINDPVREHDSLTLDAFVTLEWVNHTQNSVNVPFGDTMTTNFSSGCDIMEIRWKSKHIS
jgi:hypothetical protein